MGRKKDKPNPVDFGVLSKRDTVIVERGAIWVEGMPRRIIFSVPRTSIEPVSTVSLDFSIRWQDAGVQDIGGKW